MKVQFKGVRCSDVVSEIRARLKRSNIGSLVSLNYKGGDLEVVVKKLGTSKLQFSVHEESSPDACTTLSLEHKKIPLAHRLLERELVAKLTEIIETSGGDVLEPYQL